MKFYDLEELSEDFKKYGTEKKYDDNKYYITAHIAARAHVLSTQKTLDRKSLPNEQRYLSEALEEVEAGKILPIEEPA